MTIAKKMIMMMMMIDDGYDDKINLGLIGEVGGETERRGPGRDPAGEGGN